MYQFINQRCQLVIGQLGSIDAKKYVELHERMESGVDVASDSHFQGLYRNYWRMNVARLDAAFYAKYFQLLAEGQRSRNVDLDYIVRELAKGPENPSLQFSFATKLAHMIDPTVPVYDSFVAAFYFYVAPTPKRPFEERLNALMSFHGFLKREYDRVIRHGLLNEALQKFRTHFETMNRICDERIIDWLIWGCVSLLRGKAQRGEVLYE